MKEYDARLILREERFYISMTGVRLDVSFVPYAVETMYEEWVSKTAAIASLLMRSREIIDDVRALEERKVGLAEDDPERKSVSEQIKNRMDEITSWQKMRKDAEAMCWDIIRVTLEANDQHYAVDELKRMLCRAEPGNFIQFIVGLDDESKKNGSASKGSSSMAGSDRTGRSSASSGANTGSRGTRRSFATHGKRSRT
jgi:hypothetical protein